MPLDGLKFLVDNALSPRLADLMREHGVDAVHLREKLPVTADDQAVFDLAAKEDRVILSADTDFGVILANRGDSKPSFILLRHDVPGLPEQQWPLLSAVIAQHSDDLRRGCIISITLEKARIRQLPLW